MLILLKCLFLEATLGCVHLVQCGTLGKTPARRRLQKKIGTSVGDNTQKTQKHRRGEDCKKKLAKHRRGGDCKKKLGLQSETVTVSWHPHSQSAKHKGTSISYLVSRGHPTHILYPERQPDLSHIGLDSKLYLAAPTQPRMSRCGRARTFKASFRVRTGSNPSSSCKRVL